jgi:hypothetical protein
MRLEPIYMVNFTTPEAWSVEVAGDAGIESRSFLLAEGRSTGRLSARYRAANFLGSGRTVRSYPSFVGFLQPTTEGPSCSSGKDLRYAATPAADDCSEASSTRPTTPGTAG